MSNPPVKVWEEKVIIPTYGIGKPDKNPMFFEKRIYQGSSGAVYPNAVIEKINDDKGDKTYNAVYLENKYLKIMILPELGGRVQMAYDKIKQRHFVYYNQVIKPALVGLTGPWISGGIEFNWPQHHRPSTFEPIDHTIEENTDGSKTIWVNEIERMFGTKCLAGFTLHPDKAYLEISAKLYNRTTMPQTFLWWANPAVKVNDDYQSVFPPDVNAVFDHGKRDVSTFPIATGTYYKVDYSSGTDISRYKNIPVPTSYMAINSDYDFVGGYEHDTQAGVLHVANHHISPGKKQWTWGYSDFGQAWDRNLTDEDGPYIELMTGVFTDNQPDFSWLMPYEEKAFTQYFLPYQNLGLVKNATKDVLVNFEKQGNLVKLMVYATSQIKQVMVSLSIAGETVFKEISDISPEILFEKSIAIDPGTDENSFVLSVVNAKGKELIKYEPASNKKNKIPEAAKPALQPKDVENPEQLFLTGQHLEQYRHATYSPISYYEEALIRDPNDIRNNNALGAWYMRRGQFAKAEPYFRQAVATTISRNPNPYDGEPYYNLGLCLNWQGKTVEAYSAFYKATWSYAWQDAARFCLSKIDTSKGEYQTALEHINLALNRNTCSGKYLALKAAILRKLREHERAIVTCTEALNHDPFNFAAIFEKLLVYCELNDAFNTNINQHELLQLSRKTSHNLIEYALDYAAAGLYAEAYNLLSFADADESPLVSYHLAAFAYILGHAGKMNTHFQIAKDTSSYLCFPNRLEDMKALQFAIAQNPNDAKAPYYLGNLWYDKRQYTEAINNWELSVKIDDNFPTVHRNLGIAYFNRLNDAAKALKNLERAFELDKTDARILMELDQLYKRLNKQPQLRLQFLEANLQTVTERDDLYLELASLYNFIGEYHKAYDLIMARKFHPWEGGEGRVSGQYIFSLVELAKQNINTSNYQKAIEQLEKAQVYPHNLGEGKLYGAQENDIFYWLGYAYEGLGELKKAIEYYQKATIGLSEPGAAMFYNDQQPDKIFYQGLAWKKLNEQDKADHIFNNLVSYGQTHLNDEVMIDYFAVSLPNLLIFDDDLNLRNQIHCRYILGLGLLGLNKTNESSTLLVRYFDEVLKLDVMHFGAIVHRSILL